jgi:hypothetical protein
MPLRVFVDLVNRSITSIEMLPEIGACLNHCALRSLETNNRAPLVRRERSVECRARWKIRSRAGSRPQLEVCFPGIIIRFRNARHTRRDTVIKELIEHRLAQHLPVWPIVQKQGLLLASGFPPLVEQPPDCLEGETRLMVRTRIVSAFPSPNELAKSGGKIFARLQAQINAHEQAVQQPCAEKLPAWEISQSGEVLPLWRPWGSFAKRSNRTLASSGRLATVNCYFGPHREIHVGAIGASQGAPLLPGCTRCEHAKLRRRPNSR